jgi:hypothetical protein
LILIYLFVVMSAQLACIIHLFRHDRWLRWLMPLIFFPLSPIAYFAVEILPDLYASWKERKERRKLAIPADPKAEFHDAQRAFDLVDSAANRLRLADACTALGQHRDALPHYERATLGRMDFRTGEKLARCLFLNDRPADALKVLDESPRAITRSDRDTVALLRARVLEDLRRYDEALEVYADVTERLAGDEALCRYAGLLLKVGHTEKARLALEEVEHRMTRRDQLHRSAHAPMYDWAMKQLTELRAYSGSSPFSASASPAR